MLRFRLLLSHSLLLSFLTPTGFLCLFCILLLSSFSTTFFIDCSLSISSVSFAVFSFIKLTDCIVLIEKIYTNCLVTILKVLSLGCFLFGRTLMVLEKFKSFGNRAMSYYVHSFYWIVLVIFCSGLSFHYHDIDCSNSRELHESVQSQCLDCSSNFLFRFVFSLPRYRLFKQSRVS